ncbi:RHS repeat-associated core domain-containing protein [Streptomyces sp. NPDC058637]|uniref:RHS repeat-associated core domain-containing protein n=1 Tax=Streptomyces sp. NPDC058637 TaxID=3346569 RepID=UPI00364F88E9
MCPAGPASRGASRTQARVTASPWSGEAENAHWLGGHQRSGEAVTGLTLMGVRLYDSATGRFLSIDPVNGGSCNRYDYVCADPVNMLDPDGRMAVAALVGAAGLGVSLGTVPAVIGAAAVVAIIGLNWCKGKSWAIRKVKTLWREARKSGEEKATTFPASRRGSVRRPANPSTGRRTGS